MRYYLDTEFDGYGGELLSLALVSADDRLPELYLSWPRDRCTQWVAENVIPRLIANGTIPLEIPLAGWPLMIEGYFKRVGVESGRPGHVPEIWADWPDDLARFSQLLMTGPGTMINIPGVILNLARVDAYPTDLGGAVQHNALWDARVLRHKLAR